MLRKNQPSQSLNPPPIATTNPGALEVLRVWASPGEPQQFTLRTCWDDPGAWGLLLVDIARHAAQAYQRDGYDADETLQRIRELFDAEWDSPTTPADDITDQSSS